MYIIEMVTILLRIVPISVAHKPTELFQSILCNLKGEMTKGENSDIIFKINCTHYDKFYIEQNGCSVHLSHCEY